jgi:hypothetical protein
MWGDKQGRNDLDQVVVTRREKAQIAVHRRDAPEVLHQLVDAFQEPLTQLAFTA